MPAKITELARFPTGVPGLDEILKGGVPRNALILIEGPPGSGKTTIALEFLLNAARRGEICMLASNAETPEQLRAIAAAHGWVIDGIHITGLPDGTDGEDSGAEYTLFPEAEIEIGKTLEHLFSEIDRLKPTLLVIDTISSLRVLAPTPAFHRRQLRRIRDYTAARACTTVMLDEASMTEKDLRSQTLSDGLIELQNVDCIHGADRRRLRVRKLRGCDYLSGAHDFTLQRGGVSVYPRLVAATHATVSHFEPLTSGVSQIDALTGCGIPPGSSTLVTGPAGIGKSSIATLYVTSAAVRGQRSCVLLFDESVESHLTRSDGLGLKMTAARDEGLVELYHLDPAELSVGRITDLVIREVEDKDAKVVVIDTLNGYLQSAMDEPTVLLHLRELISYLSRRQIVLLLTLAQHGILAPSMTTPVDLSYLADTVFLLRYFEADGAIRKALSVVKKRTGIHDTTIREIVFKAGGIEVSEPLAGFSGVLTGTPVYAPPTEPRGA